MGKFANIQKMVDISMKSWHQATENGLTGIRTARTIGNKFETESGHRFINLVSCSYLGLNRHPKVLEGAIEAIRKEQMLSISVSRARIAPRLLDETEDLMSELFRAKAVLTLSCTAASAGILPLIASGHFTAGEKPFMIFDTNSHFSMNVVKAVCGDETEVVTCDHSDLNFIEDACKKYPVVAYVADGAYSMGGVAPIAHLLELQDKYGLFLYLDDSHSISACGERGVGLVRSEFGDLTPRTIIVGSLAKAFGACGGLILTGDNSHRDLIDFCAGPLGWSQMVNTAGLGAIKASAEIHMSEELPRLQEKLKSVMNLIDQTAPTANAGNGLPIRIFDLPSVENAVEMSAELYKRGFYCSAVFFPIVARGRAGIRAMGRADLDTQDVQAFCKAISEIINNSETRTGKK